MNLQQMIKEIQALKNELVPESKSTEVLLKSDPHALTDHELFRVIQHFTPSLKSESELTDEVLEKMAKGEYEE